MLLHSLERRLVGAGSDVEPPPPVLVIGADERTCTQLEEVLAAEQQTERYLERQFSRYVLKKAAAQGWQTGAKAPKADGKQGGDKAAAGASKPGAGAAAAGDEDAGAADDGKGKGKPEGGQEQKKPVGQKEGGGAEEVSAEVLKQRRERSLLYTEARRLARHHGGVLDSDGHGAAGAADEEEAEADGSSADFEAQFGVYASPHVLLHALGTRWRSERLLESVRPLYVVMYDPDAAFVRCLCASPADSLISCPFGSDGGLGWVWVWVWDAQGGVQGEQPGASAARVLPDLCQLRGGAALPHLRAA